MGRWLIIFGVTMIAIGILWPWLQRFGFGRLPGDIVIERGNFRLFIPLMTSVVISLIFSILIWLFKR